MIVEWQMNTLKTGLREFAWPVLLYTHPTAPAHGRLWHLFTFGNIRLIRHTLIAVELALLTGGLGGTSAGAGILPALKGSFAAER